MWLARYPDITTTRLFEELRAVGYQGGYTILRERVHGLRGSRKPLVRRFETLPGQQAQMDWGVYTLDFTDEGRRRVNCFSYVLGYSRRQSIRFTESQDMTTLLREHVRAFAHLGGVAATCLYDNQKAVVTRWEDEQPLYNTKFLAFATHYGFRPIACRPRRPQTKGKVERPFWYVETNLLNGRTFRGLEHLVVYRVVDAEGCIGYDRHGYSVPWQLVGQMLPVRVEERELVERAVRYGAFTWQSLERILAVIAKPRPANEVLAADYAAPLCDDPIPPRSTSEYQHLLDDRPPDAPREESPVAPPSIAASPPANSEAPHEPNQVPDENRPADADSFSDPAADSGPTS